MKNGLFTIMSAEKEVGVDEVKHRKGKQRRNPPKEGNAVNVVGLEGTSLL